MEIEASVDRAIDSMPADFAIRRFLVGNRAEVRGMCITEYNEAETLRMLREEVLEEGREEGREEGLVEGVEKGEDRLGDLMGQLLAKGRTDDAQRATTDKAARGSCTRSSASSRKYRNKDQHCKEGARIGAAAATE